MSTSDSCNVGASKSTCDDALNDLLQKMRTDGTDVVAVCANCGKEGSDVNNACNKCKQVKYCNAVCKKVHKKKHKKDCEEHIRLASEHAAKLRDKELFKQPPPEEDLFKQPPPQLGDCPICFLRMPILNTGSRYMTCCGKIICSGCYCAPVYDDQGNEVDNDKCPFCRTPTPDTKEGGSKRMKKRVEANDPIAIYNNSCDYSEGTNGFSQDYIKALELWHRAAELGYAPAYRNIANSYKNGRGVENDEKKAAYYWVLGAIGGDVEARYNLGNMEGLAGNVDRAIKHFMIAIEDGDADSLKQINRLYSIGLATKDDYTKALQSYQAYLDEIKSPQRDKAAAHSDRFQYY